MYLLFRCICPHKSSMGHLIQWESLFFFQIPHKSSMGHLFRCGSSIYSFLIDSHTSPLWVACFGVDRLFFSYRISLKSSMGRLFRCESSILLLSYKPSIGSLVLFSICTCACACMCMCGKGLYREIAPPTTLLQ